MCVTWENFVKYSMMIYRTNIEGLKATIISHLKPSTTGT